MIKNKQKKIRVLCFGRFYDEIPGGMQRHVEHLFAALANEVEFVHLVPSRTREGAEFLVHGFPVIRTPSINMDGSLAVSPQLILKALQLHKKYQFDLIHLHFPDPMSHLASMFLPSSIPRIISWHADIIRQRKLFRFYRPLLRHAIKKASAIVVATPSHIESSLELMRITDKDRLHVIPYGFDLERFVSENKSSDMIQGQYPGKIIFALGRHVYYKGFDILINAMKDIHPDARLLIGGVGPLTPKLKELVARLGLEKRINFLGLIKEKDLPVYYQASDIFCLPAISQAEAFGIVQVEAMASGLPVVSTELHNGVSYVNRDGVSGLIVPPSDPDALADAINKLLDNDELRNKLAMQARERALKEFSFESMGQRMLKLYEDVVAART
ncbi:MAG: glycosyltransferase [Proteobacteria bacterium]|nr:glycosyltransferase [Pseudomonadota bacterium]